MGSSLRLNAADGHALDAYSAAPSGASVGSVVIVQEIFGITAHIERVVDEFAAQGFHAVAPAMFDRIGGNIVIDYADPATGRATMQKLAWEETLLDLDAAIDAVGTAGRVAVVGFCWGGTVAHVAAAERKLPAAVAYYGGGIVRHLDQVPRCPILYHFGDQDQSIPMSAVREIEHAVPEGEFHVYAGAAHGFNCDDRPSYDAEAAQQAFGRTLEFLRRHLRG